MAAVDIQKVSILGTDSIHCGFHLAPYIADTVTQNLASSTYVLVTDANLAPLHLAPLRAEFERALGAGQRFLSHVVPPGETVKSRAGKAGIEDFMLAHACTRDTVVLALGGGVIGDLVGFTAATFMRGVRFVQIPTTLLAMVDSSVGGKTAVDTPHGKNLIGAFWQPAYVFIDAAYLETLPPREFSNGMAEVVKTAAIWDADEFALLESRSADIFTAIQTPSENNDGRTLSTRSDAQALLLRVIRASIAVKAHIVTLDERETGLRNLVNFGHTIGHALEAVLTPYILHGECVSIGIVREAEVSRALGHLSQGAVGRLVRALQAYNLPVSTADTRISGLPAARGLSVERLMEVMKVDKKNSGPQKKIVLLARIGRTVEERASAVADAVIARALCEAVRVVAGTPSCDPVSMATPGSKSMSNRAMVLAALGVGTCRLTNLLHSDDTQVMMAALQDLQGAKFSWEDGGETLVVEGGGGKLSVPPAGKELYLGNAGTAARFLTAVCALVHSAEPSHPTIITGNKRMKQRPIGALVDALRANGSPIAYRGSDGCLPLAISPLGLKGGVIRLAASVSSQYVSAVLLTAPYAREEVTLELVGGAVVSQAYIDMTLAMMAAFGVHATRAPGSDTYRVPRGTYRNPGAYAVESDASSATYPLAVAAVTGTACTVRNIGRGSLQGDARFARDVLGRMGCEVVQTETETTVRGPPVGTLRALGEVDMEPMTDAFLTASVLAAVAARPQEGQGRAVSRIVGIANQRVKECNRIRAMMDELAKFGVETKELEDGLEIYGRPIGELKEGVSVHCYDDHRVAMAHSVLGTVVKGTILEEKRCVEKTWPSWWDDLENKIGIKVEGVDLSSGPSSSSSPPPRDPSASVVIIGMRGSGKTYIGEAAASCLSWSFVDADIYFEEKHKNVRSFVETEGWPAFREAETKILEELLAKYPSKCIISLGGGIVETPAARDVLKAYMPKGPVVHIERGIDEVVAYLGQETARPAYGEPIEAVFARRAPWFAECSSHAFVNDTTHGSPTTTRREVNRFFHHVTGVRPNLVRNLGAARTYFLCLTFPDVTPALGDVEALTAGADAVELRVDLLRDPTYDAEKAEAYVPPVAYVERQVAALRRETTLPIIFTVRSAPQGGSHPAGAEKEAFELLQLALRLGVEYVDVETSWAQKAIDGLVAKKGSSQILASWHDWSGRMKWDGDEVKDKYAEAARFGDIVKIVGKANSMDDNITLRRFVSEVSAAPDAKPVIAINMGTKGQLSRILNYTLSPITHPLLPSAAAPGQLSFAQIQQALHLSGELPARRFFLFGTPIQHSMSPTLHNTAFKALGLPYNYGLFETATVDHTIDTLVKARDFGGASVTIPFKREVQHLLNSLTPAAKATGAVNTIVVVPKGDDAPHELYGDNTDWIGICDCVRARSPHAIDAALVIGAGGTARAAIYALGQLGAKRIYLFNRTKARAQELVDAFPDAGVELVDALGVWPGPPPTVILGTVPASATTLDATALSAVHLPSSLFAAPAGVVVDMAYKPAETPLLALASSAPGWRTVRGIDVLLEQGYHQFELFTGRTCPRKLVAEVVLGEYAKS